MPAKNNQEDYTLGEIKITPIETEYKYMKGTDELYKEYYLKNPPEMIQALKDRIKELENKLLDKDLRIIELEAQEKFWLKQGWEAGVRDFAIWKDGEQVVGCRQTPLKEVLKKGPNTNLLI